MTNERRRSLDDVLSEVRSLDDPDLRAEYLLELAARYSPVPETIAAPPYPAEAQVPACESRAFVFTSPRPDGTLSFHYVVENPHGVSARAMAVVLQEAFSGAPLKEVEQVSTDIVPELFGASLSMGKDQGLRNLVLATRTAARRHSGSGGSGGCC